MHSTPWLIRRPGAPRRMRLFCFPYAGGAASGFLPWQAGLPFDVEVCAVQLPGRGARLNEPPIRDLAKLVDALTEIVIGHGQQPFAFFGHSLGGLLAFELTRQCHRLRLPLPCHLFVAGCPAPSSRPAPRKLHELGDDALIEALRDYNGTPPEALAHRELMALLLPAIRADFELLANHRHEPGRPLDTPITVLAGTGDKHVAPESLVGWQECSTHPCRLHWFDGDHFFLHSANKAVMACLRDELARNRTTP